MLVYRLLLTLSAPLAAAFALRQVLRGAESVQDLKERFGSGLDTAAVPSGPVLWLHGASNGELTSARPLIEELLQRNPQLNLIVTVNSVNARHMVREWGIPQVSVRLAPLDLARTTHHFISCTQPNALLSLENEIWPNRFTLCAKHGVPVIVAGARMSQKTAETWEKHHRILGAMTHATLNAISGLAPQDQASKERFLSLGLPEKNLLPQMNLKSGVELESFTPEDSEDLRLCFQKENTILAASTHEGEDGPILSAFSKTKKQTPQVKLILAPRHPRRADAIEAIARDLGLSVARRSRKDPAAGADVYIADTLGEMAFWYAISGYTFVGGSLVEKGGHTPFEPAQFGCVILHGPHVSNHAQAFSALAKAGGALEVSGAEALADTFTALLDAPDYAAQIAQTGTAALADIRSADVGSLPFWNTLNGALAPTSHKPLS